MRISRSGSSLVFVLLMMAVISVILLAGSSALLNAARQRSALESSHIAVEMQQSAMQEGLLRLQGGTTEYGVGTSASLTARIRGFQTGTTPACSQWVQDGTGSQYAQLTTPDSNCPYYELTIRRFVIANSYTYQNQDINPNGAGTVTLTIKGTAEITFTANPAALATFSAVFCDTNNVCQPAQNGVNSFPTLSAGTVTFSNYVYTAGTTPTNTTDVMTAAAQAGTGPFILDKGYTTMETTGVAADGTQSSSLTIIRPSGTVTTPTTETFNALGLCSPDTTPPTACR